MGLKRLHLAALVGKTYQRRSRPCAFIKEDRDPVRFFSENIDRTPFIREDRPCAFFQRRSTARFHRRISTIRVYQRISTVRFYHREYRPCAFFQRRSTVRFYQRISTVRFFSENIDRTLLSERIDRAQRTRDQHSHTRTLCIVLEALHRTAILIS